MHSITYTQCHWKIDKRGSQSDHYSTSETEAWATSAAVWLSANPAEINPRACVILYTHQCHGGSLWRTADHSYCRETYSLLSDKCKEKENAYGEVQQVTCGLVWIKTLSISLHAWSSIWSTLQLKLILHRLTLYFTSSSANPNTPLVLLFIINFFTFSCHFLASCLVSSIKAGRNDTVIQFNQIIRTFAHNMGEKNGTYG